MLACLLAALLGAGGPPGQVTLKTDALEITLGSEAAWTIMTLSYRGTPLIIKAGGQGAVINPRGGDWIGAAMTAGGEEQVQKFTIAADGEAVELPRTDPIRSNNIVMTKKSLLSTIEHGAETTFEADLILQKHSFKATEDIDLSSFYCFLYSVTPDTDQWLAQPLAGALMEGELTNGGAQQISRPVQWLAQYDADSGKGMICYYPTPFAGAGSFSSIWDQKGYHKFLAQPMAGKLAAGTELSYTLVMKMFSAAQDTWKSTATQEVEELKERFPQTGEVAAAPTERLYDEGVPEQGFMTVETERLKVIFQAESAWTIDEIHYRGEQLAGPTGHYGTVLIPQGGQWIGTGHSEGGREIVHTLKLTVDGQETPVQVGTTLEGHEIVLTKTSTIHKFAATHTITITDDEIVERAQLKATEDHALSRMYLFMHCWPKETTKWLAELPDGETIEGALVSQKGHGVDRDTRWVAQYLPDRNLGMLCYTPKVATTDTSKSFIWDEERYHKYYVQHNEAMSFAAGDELDFTMVVKVVPEETGDWAATKAAAAELAQRYPHIDPEEQGADG